MKLVFFAAVVALVSYSEATKHSKYIFSIYLMLLTMSFEELR